jgi:nicotinate-nucleotide adenylyltransferase
MSSKIQRLGVFGGSFDPPHGGHLHAARAASQAFGLDQILFVPAARPPHKPGRNLVSGQHRAALLELLIAGQGDFSVDTRELDRPGPSFTVDTLGELAGDRELYLIIGTDNLAGLPSWRDLGRILELAQPIIIHRAGERAQHLAELESELPGDQLACLERGFVELPPVEVSSTELRQALRGGQEPTALLPPDLRNYIQAHGLYLEGE